MDIKLKQVSIHNFRSLKSVDVILDNFSVLFGSNDSGKSNFLIALKLALGSGSIDERDVYSSPETPFDNTTIVSIDLKFVPINDDGVQVKEFNELWGLHLGENVAIDSDEKEFFAFRTEFTYNPEREDFVRDRKVINEWDADNIVVGSTIRYKTISVFDYVYLDAQRDISVDIRDSNSLWSKQMAKIKLSPESKGSIEDSLSDLGSQIMRESPFLQQVSSDLSSATNSQSCEIEISPIAKSIDGLYKGLDIFVSQSNASAFPISYLGQGTRSRAVFSTLKSIVNKKLEDANESPYFCMVAFEEPEAHIHPHSQRQLVLDFSKIESQRIITTHSPYILSSTDICNLIYVNLIQAKSTLSSLASLELTQEEVRHIERFVLNTRGELLFSNVVVLGEGETEEQALPIFFKEYFDLEPFELGVSFVGVGGKNYLPFLRVLESVGIKWCIFSDGEAAAINDLKTTMRDIYRLPAKPELSNYDKIIVLDNSNDFEKYLLDSGYTDEIIRAINNYKDKDLTEDQVPYFQHYVQKHDGAPMSPRSTGVKCESCGQTIKEGNVRDYTSEGGERRALIDCMKSGKTKYAVPISHEICSSCEGDRKFPPKIKLLLEKIEECLEV